MDMGTLQRAINEMRANVTPQMGDCPLLLEGVPVGERVSRVITCKFQDNVVSEI